MKKSSKKLLKEFVEQTLREDDGGFGDMGGMSPYGIQFADRNQMSNMFIKPFTDVFKVAAGKTKELSSKTITLVDVAFKVLATTIIPILKQDYDEVFERGSSRIEQIKSEYADVYNATWDVFKNKDLAIIAFMYAPAACLLGKLGKSSAKSTSNLLSILSGGTLDNFISKAKSKFGDERSGNKKDPKDYFDGGGENSGNYGEGILREDVEKPKSLVGLLTNKKVVNKAVENQKSKEMQAKAKKTMQTSWAEIYKQAKNIMAAKNIQDLEQKIGKKIPGSDKLQAIPEKERHAAEAQLLSGVKKSMKKFYVDNLSVQIKSVVEAGIPENSEFIVDLKNVIAKINSIA